MKKYNITVNGTSYDVEVEEVGGAPATSVAAPATPVAAPAAPKPVAPSTVAPAAGAQKIDCPMPGTILDIKVKPGDAVSAGQVLLILEAMKMENEIAAPSAGTVDTIPVAKGSAVNAGDILVTLV